MSKDVLLDVVNNTGVITFNKEKTLNALTEEMGGIALHAIRTWQRDKSAVIIKGKRNFSAGGDIKSVWEKDFKGPTNLYNTVYAVNNSQIPVIAVIDGITMGAGLAIAVFAKYRIATEDSEAAMPEVRVGMLPDVGGSYFLSRMKHNLGVYMGLTGSSMRGKDVLRSGIATHFVLKKNLTQMENALLTCNTDDDINRVLDQFSELEDVSLPMADNIKNIEFCFGGKSVGEILERLEGVRNEWSAETIAALRSACPGSLKITFSSLQRGRELDLLSCLQMDYRLVYWSLRNHDFREGVRAILFEKDRKPIWNPKSLADVSEEYVNSFFENIPKDRELQMLPIFAKL